MPESQTTCCRYCGNAEWPYCMNSRDMTDFAIEGSDRCFAALEKQGWGENGERYVRLNREAAIMPAEIPTTAVWTEGVCGDGAAILRDGVFVSISDVLATLNERERLRTALLWYADTQNYDQRAGGFAFAPTVEEGVTQAPIICDCGQHAQEALEGHGRL